MISKNIKDTLECEYLSIEKYFNDHSSNLLLFVEILIDEVSKDGILGNIKDVSLFKEQMSFTAKLHDLGKLDIPVSVLGKQGRLSDDEFLLIREHCINGARRLESLFRGLLLVTLSDRDLFDLCFIVCMQHHERLDGSGYPLGLMGDDIHICSKIMAIADSYDAMTSKRCYKDMAGFKESIDELKSMKDKYDIGLVSAFERGLVREGFFK